MYPSLRFGVSEKAANQTGRAQQTRTAASSSNLWNMRTSRPILAGIFFVLTCICGCAKPNLRDSLSSMHAPQGSPMLLAIYQPWFGDGEHINVGYSCHHPIVLRPQISQAPELNIGGFVVYLEREREQVEDQTLCMPHE